MATAQPDWLSFISSRLGSQISFENARKARLWALALLGFFSLGFALSALARVDDHNLGFHSKVAFLMMFHPLMAFGFYLPSALQKGGKPLAKLFSIRDFFSLTLAASSLALLATALLVMSFQVAGQISNLGLSGFFGMTARIGALVCFIYFCAALYYFFGLFWFPGGLARLVEQRGAKKAPFFFLGLHGVIGALQAFSYPEAVSVTGSGFFEPLRIAGLFWIWLLSALVLLGKMLRESAVPALSHLELEIASGKIAGQEAVLTRVKEAFVLKRLVRWIQGISHDAAAKAHEIAGYAHEAVTLVDRDLPSELDLRGVEDRYRRAEQIYKKLEKDNQRFLVSVSFFDTAEVEREKIDGLRDQFSRELRNAKLELASVRKKIDEKLVSIKNNQPSSPPPPSVVSAAPSSISSAEKVPVSR